MAKYLTILFLIFFIGCEINSEQLIQSESINFENIKFNTVSKNLNFSNSQIGNDVDYTKKLITNWFNKNISQSFGNSLYNIENSFKKFGFNVTSSSKIQPNFNSRLSIVCIALV